MLDMVMPELSKTVEVKRGPKAWVERRAKGIFSEGLLQILHCHSTDFKRDSAKVGA